MQEVTLHLEQNTDFHIKEAFKTLRSNVEFCGSDVKVVAVTSCTPHEGKTSVAMEMAKSFAEAGNKTLLIDADMRKSVLVGRYKTGAVKYGLSHCLVGKYRYSDAMCQTNISRLYMFFSGPVPPNPSELLGSDRFVDMLNVMRTAFDYIIIDTPPLGSVIDAAVVAKRCDGTVLVVESNAVNYRFVQKVKEQLDKAESRILGVVLNKVDLNKKGYYGHYGKYYGKYYGRYGYDVDTRPTPSPAQKPERSSAGERFGGIPRTEPSERAERLSRPEAADRTDRTERPGYADRADRTGSSEYADRLNRMGGSEYIDRLNRTGDSEHINSADRTGRTEYSDRSNRAGRSEITDRVDRLGRLGETEKKTVNGRL